MKSREKVLLQRGDDEQAVSIDVAGPPRLRQKRCTPDMGQMILRRFLCRHFLYDPIPVVIMRGLSQQVQHAKHGTVHLFLLLFLADATSMTSSRWRGSRCTASRPGPTQRNAQSTPIRRSKETKDPNRMHAAGLSLNVEYLSISPPFDWTFVIQNHGNRWALYLLLRCLHEKRVIFSNHCFHSFALKERCQILNYTTAM